MSASVARSLKADDSLEVSALLDNVVDLFPASTEGSHRRAGGVVGHDPVIRLEQALYNPFRFWCRFKAAPFLQKGGGK